MSQVKRFHERLFDKLASFYKSSRTRCLFVRDSDQILALDTCMVLQPFDATARFVRVWESESLSIVDYFAPLKEGFHYNSFLNDKSVDLGKDKVSIPQEGSIQYYSYIFYGKSWLKRYTTESNGVSFQKIVRMPDDFQQRLRPILADEVEAHPCRPYRSLEMLSTNLMGGNRDILREAFVEVAAPFWAHINNVKANASNRMIRCDYAFAPSIESAETGSGRRLRGCHSYHLKDGSLVDVPVGWMKQKNQDIRRNELAHYTEYEMKFDPKEIFSITTTLNLDGEIALEWETIELGTAGHLLWPLLREIDNAMGSQMLQSMTGKSATMKCDSLELAAANLLSALGFKTALVGPLGYSGVDILAVPPEEDSIVAVECSRANVRQKVADCARAIERLREIMPHYRFYGAVVISDSVTVLERESIGRSGIAVFDSSDIKKLTQQAETNPKADLVMNVVRGHSIQVTLSPSW